MLEPGMVLARNVPSGNPLLPLIVAGRPLTGASILNAQNRGVQGLYVELEGTEDIACEEVLEPEQKQVMLAEIKSEFVKAERSGKDPNYRAISKMAESIVLQVLNNEKLLCDVMDIRDYDNYTYAHSLYVGIISTVIGSHLGLNSFQLTNLAMAGLLHDIGKLDIPSEIINKPDRLTKEEFDQIKEHPSLAVKRLYKLPYSKDTILQGIATHHEHYDGTGYPAGLEKNKIPLFGRILTIADVFDALTSNRSYRKAWTSAQVIDYIVSRSGTQFDPDILGSFLKSVTAYPVGTLVALSDGSTGVVAKNNPEFTLRPTVRLLSPPESLHRELDLSKEAFHITVLDAITKHGNPPAVPAG